MNTETTQATVKHDNIQNGNVLVEFESSYWGEQVHFWEVWRVTRKYFILRRRNAKIAMIHMAQDMYDDEVYAVQLDQGFEKNQKLKLMRRGVMDKHLQCEKIQLCDPKMYYPCVDVV